VAKALGNTEIDVKRNLQRLDVFFSERGEGLVPPHPAETADEGFSHPCSTSQKRHDHPEQAHYTLPP